MEVTIFYSWQSDLPNNKNRGFIQNCIEKAVKLIAKDKIHLEIAIDRDTQGVTGTPDITSSIFSKIESAKIFIADISIINSQEAGRKTPNPNVLIELGYAAKTLDWNNIISIFNTEFGKVEDLPFDLRFRRHLSYEIKNDKDKSNDKSKLVEIIKDAIEAIIDKEHDKDEVRRYIKRQVNKEIITICSQLFKILYSYEKEYTLESVWQMLNLTDEEIQKELFERRFLGFTVLKDWSVFVKKLQDALDNPFFNQHAQQVYISSLIKVVRGLEAIVVVFNNDKLFIDTDKTVDDYRVKMNPENPTDSYLLTKEIEETGEVVRIDSGTIRQYNLRRTKMLLKINGELFFDVTISIRELLKGIHAWTSATGNLFDN